MRTLLYGSRRRTERRGLTGVSLYRDSDKEFLKVLEGFVDLLLFHREQHCLVAVELAIYPLTATLPTELRSFPSTEEPARRLDAVTAALQGQRPGAEASTDG